ncbi:MAG: hypothetical protein V3T72_13415 [Thermoanaerobaculia bacterium]
MRSTKLFAVWISALALAFGAAGCRQPPEPAPGAAAVGERVENAAAGVAITAVPPVMKLVAVDGERIVLGLFEEGAAGEIIVTPGEPEVGGINLVAAVESHKQEILQRPGGDYKGQRELGSHLGTAFYSRGRYLMSQDGDALEEETVIFLVHPWGDRTLQLIYRYPAGEDSTERIQDHLFALLGEIEPLATEGTAGGGH